jgi:cysteine-rich repeat protein
MKRWKGRGSARAGASQSSASTAPSKCAAWKRSSGATLWFVVALAACATTPSEISKLSVSEQCLADGEGNAGCDAPACDAACRRTCGNGKIDPGEQCDDGNWVDGDGCESNCTLPACGNGIRDVGEQCDDGNSVGGDGCESNCTLPACGNGIRDVGEQCDDGNSANGDGCSAACTASTTAYVKASNTHTNDQFGTSVALSADGSTLAVGAPVEGSGATGVDGNQADDSAIDAGAVYVFTRSGTTWERQAYLKASNTRAGAQFGMMVALSADGSTLVVGAPLEDSGATGVNGDQADHSAPWAGAVYVFTRSGTTWQQQAYLKASNTAANGLFGNSAALTADGSTLAVGAIFESSGAIGVNGDQTDRSKPSAGAVYVFTRSGTTWQQQAYLKASNTGIGDSFGASVALSTEGTTLAVGAATEDSAATGINGNQADNSAIASGAVYVFTYTGGTWSQQAYIKASNTSRADAFGASVALSGDGSTLAVGAYAEDSGATGINGNQTNDAIPESGAAYIFTRSGTTWSQQAYVKASNTGLTAEFGWSLAMSPDGSMLAVAAVVEDSDAIGIDGDQHNVDALASGAVYMFRRDATRWWQQAYIKASNTGSADQFGWSVSIAADGTVAVGALGEASAATGVGGDQNDDSEVAAGAVYVVR